MRLKNEDDLMAGATVIWKGKKYITGNRRHTLVELYNRNGKFIRVVEINTVKMDD